MTKQIQCTIREVDGIGGFRPGYTEYLFERDLSEDQMDKFVSEQKINVDRVDWRDNSTLWVWN